MTQVGLSCYITGTQYLEPINNVMIAYGMNLIRISYRETFLGAGSRRVFRREYIDWFLENTNYTIIIEPNHIYPPNEAGAQIFRDNLDEVEEHLLYIARLYANNPRIIIEPFNEYVSNDLWTLAQRFIYLLRTVTNCPILINKWDQPWRKLDDPLDRDYYSYHFYFNTWGVNGAMDSMRDAISKGIDPTHIINTEVGADFNEEGSFSYGEVQELNDFLQRCADLGIGNAIWQFENIKNMDTYADLDLVIPDLNGEEPPETSTTTTTTTTTTPPTSTTEPPPPTDDIQEQLDEHLARIIQLEADLYVLKRCITNNL